VGSRAHADDYGSPHLFVTGISLVTEHIATSYLLQTKRQCRCAQEVRMKSRPLYQALYFQVLCAIALGAILGHAYPDDAVALKPLSDGFIRLIKMLIAPLVFTTVVVGIAGAEDMKKVGRAGGLALLYFEIGSTLALLLGLLVINVVQPGAGMHVDSTALDAGALAEYTSAPHQSLSQFLLNIVPHSVFDAFAKGEMLQVLLFSVLFGLAAQHLRCRGTALFEVIERFSQVLFAIVGFLMKLAPIGAFGAMAYTVGNYGLDALLPLGKLMATFYLTCILFVFGVLGFVARAHGFSVWKLIKHFKDELLIVLGTSSSEAVIPRLLSKLEALGASKSVVGLVLPAGYSFNLDGTSIYLTMAAIFVAQATDTSLSLTQQLTLLGVLMLTSKGAAAVPGSGFVVLAASLGSMSGIPVAGLALLLGIDRFMSEARALTNLVGNAVATLVIAKWSGDLDMRQLEAALSSEPPSAETIDQASFGGLPWKSQ
jgi:aerobic C4-dicarboxylate transport protein